MAGRTQNRVGPIWLVTGFDNMKDVGRLSPTGFVGTAFAVPGRHRRRAGEMHIVMVTDRPINLDSVRGTITAVPPSTGSGLSCSMWTAQITGREHSLRYPISSSTRRMNWK